MGRSNIGSRTLAAEGRRGANEYVRLFTQSFNKTSWLQVFAAEGSTKKGTFLQITKPVQEIDNFGGYKYLTCI